MSSTSYPAHTSNWKKRESTSRFAYGIAASLVLALSFISSSTVRSSCIPSLHNYEAILMSIYFRGRDKHTRDIEDHIFLRNNVI